jgi:serine/threonine-protein kinase TNNI3K
LRRLAGCYGRLPDSKTITGEIEVSDKILASGGFADVRCGIYMGHFVAVKTMRVAVLDDFTRIRKVSINNILSATRDAVSIIFLQRFCKEVVLWSTLSHPNVLKLVGVQGDMEKGQFTTVSEWMVHGNIMEYINNNHVNRLELVRGFTFPATPSTQMRQ